MHVDSSLCQYKMFCVKKLRNFWTIPSHSRRNTGALSCTWSWIVDRGSADRKFRLRSTSVLAFICHRTQHSVAGRRRLVVRMVARGRRGRGLCSGETQLETTSVCGYSCRRPRSWCYVLVTWTWTVMDSWWSYLSSRSCSIPSPAYK